VTERARTARMRGAMLLTACSVAGAGALGAVAPGATAAPSPAVARPQARATATPEQDPAIVGGKQLAGTGVIVNYPSASSPRLPDIRASAYVLANAGTGQVLAAKDPHGLFPPASTLKMLTAVTLIPLLNPDSTVVASQQATTVTPNIVGLVKGRPYKVSDLFNALLLISANDAAIALAQATGSLAKGVALINAEARHLQAYDIVAKDPDGLDAPGQHVSAYDEALVARQALTMPAFMKYDATHSAMFRIQPRKRVELFNQNSLLTQYPGAIGGKIGWTSAAGATYIGMARRNGVTLIVTLLHCPALTEIKYGMQLLNWGFSQNGKVRAVGNLVGPQQPPAPGPAGTARAAPGRQGAPPDTAEARGIPSSLAAASGALIMFAFAAAIVLSLLRRRAPSRRGR
jgi:serine-type D-Ala-D-Ala carboxypeptidase (penicillin-binding protein 5/6)